MDLENAYKLIQEKLYIWLKDLIRLLPNFVLAALIIVLGFFLAKLVKKVSTSIIHKFSKHQAVTDLFSTFIYLIVIGITFFAALSVLQLDKAVTSILAGAGILGLALAFAFQDIAANFMAGIFLSFRRPLQIGDIVKTNDFLGKVAHITLRDTVLITFQGHKVIIPNKEVFQKPLENFSSYGTRRVDIVVGVSYGEDLRKVRQIVLEATDKISVKSVVKEVTFFYTEFDDSSINFEVRIWVDSPEQVEYLTAKSEAIILIKEAFDKNDITIPFPIRTLDFGIKGGEKLSEMPLKILDTNKSE